jgi:hypothetical protein
MKKIILLLPVGLLSGCAIVTPHPTSMTLTPQAMEIVGPVKGESSSTRLLCVIPVNGSASLISATQNALNAAAAEAIVNPMVDDERGFGLLGLWCWQKIKVYGTGIRFKRNMPAQGSAVSEKRSEKAQARSGAKAAADTEEPAIGKNEADAVNEMESRIFKKGQ